MAAPATHMQKQNTSTCLVQSYISCDRFNRLFLFIYLELAESFLDIFIYRYLEQSVSV